MKRTIEEYTNKYDCYLGKIEKLDGFLEIRRLQKEFEEEIKQYVHQTRILREKFPFFEFN
jgi:hypothetical protein